MGHLFDNKWKKCLKFLLEIENILQPCDWGSINCGFFHHSSVSSILAHMYRPLFVTVTAQCPANEERFSSSGVILSPGFPGNYPNSQTCSWLLRMIPGTLLDIIHYYMFCSSIFGFICTKCKDTCYKVIQICL